MAVKDCRGCHGTGNANAFLTTFEGIVQPMSYNNEYVECKPCLGTGTSGTILIKLSPAAQLLLARLLSKATKDMKKLPEFKELQPNWFAGQTR